MAKQSKVARELSSMKHRDLQRACIARGLPFQEAVDKDAPTLAGWYSEHRDRTQNHNLLNEFDDWRDLILKNRGYEKGDPVFHPSLRLGYIAGRDSEGNVTSTKKPRGLGLDKKKKKKREKDSTGLFTGTKKSLTYNCQREGLSIPDTIKKVLATFPEAQEKSISIWWKRSVKESKQTK